MKPLRMFVYFVFAIAILVPATVLSSEQSSQTHSGSPGGVGMGQ